VKGRLTGTRREAFSARICSRGGGGFCLYELNLLPFYLYIPKVLASVGTVNRMGGNPRQQKDHLDLKQPSLSLAKNTVRKKICLSQCSFKF